MANAVSNTEFLIETNKEQLRERVKVDEHFIHCHWSSERALVAFIPPTARSILDLGCGPTGGLSMHVPDMAYVGLDLVHEYLAKLRRENPVQGPWEFSRRQWVASLMETLPFPDESFDVVYSRHALEHSPNLKSTLHEIRRILKPGGLFIFCVPARVDDTEPTHFTRWSGRQWLKAFRPVGRIRFWSHHDFFIDELYGYAEKPGQVHPPLMNRFRRLVSFLFGQGLLPSWTRPMLVRVDATLRRQFPHG